MPVTRSNDREKPSDHQRDKRSFATKVLDFFIPTAAAGADDLKTLGPEKSSNSSVQAQNIPSDIQEKQEAFELSLARAQLASEHPGANVSCTRTEAEGSVTDICRGTTSQKKDIVVGRQESSDGGLHYIYQSADRNERLIVHQNGDTEYQTTTHYFPKFSDDKGIGQIRHIEENSSVHKNIVNSPVEMPGAETPTLEPNISDKKDSSMAGLFFSSLDPNLARSSDDSELMSEMKMYGRAAKNLRDGTLHAATHPVDTVVDLGVLGLDLTCAASRAVGGGCFSDVGRSEARIEGIKNFWKNSDALDKREAIMTNGAGLLFGTKPSVSKHTMGYLGKNLDLRVANSTNKGIFNQFGKATSLDFAPAGFLDGQMYPNTKKLQLGKYLYDRGADVVTIKEYKKAAFQAKNPLTGRPTFYFPADSTVLQIKHELSHYLDWKKLGTEVYENLTPYQKEQMVCTHLKKYMLCSTYSILYSISAESYICNI